MLSSTDPTSLQPLRLVYVSFGCKETVIVAGFDPGARVRMPLLGVCVFHLLLLDSGFCMNVIYLNNTQSLSVSRETKRFVALIETGLD